VTERMVYTHFLGQNFVSGLVLVVRTLKSKKTFKNLLKTKI